MRHHGASSHGNASATCCAVHAADGESVTAKWTDAAGLASQNEQNEERAECRGRYDEEIHRGQNTNLVLQEPAPPLRPRTPAARQKPADRALRDLDPELGELAVDARRTPITDWDSPCGIRALGFLSILKDVRRARAPAIARSQNLRNPSRCRHTTVSRLPARASKPTMWRTATSRTDGRCDQIAVVRSFDAAGRAVVEARGCRAQARTAAESPREPPRSKH